MDNMKSSANLISNTMEGTDMFISEIQQKFAGMRSILDNNTSAKNYF